MNKNWLYRLLALALVAMLAIPMFALAEEEAFDLSAAEGVVVEEKKDAEYVDVVADPDNGIVIDLDSAYNYDAEADITMGTVYLVDEDGSRLSFSKVKSSNTKYATISKNGKITLKKKGDVTLTVTGENSEGEDEKKLIRLTITDYYKVDKIKAYIYDGVDVDDIKDALDGADEEEADPEELAEELEALLEDAAFDDKDSSFSRTYPQGTSRGLFIDVDACASGLDDDVVAKANGGEVSLKSSNTKIAKVTKVGYNLYTVKVDGVKTGSAKLTFTSKQKGSNKKWVMTIKIEANKSKTTTKSQIKLMQSAADDAEDVIMGVQKIAFAGQKKFKKNGETVTKNKWDVTVFVCNGTGRKIKKVKKLYIPVVYENMKTDEQTELGAYGDVDKNGNPNGGSKTVNWKKGTNYYKFTIETDVDDEIPNFTKEYFKAKVVGASFEENVKDPTPIIVKGEE